ncbi:hypothetical protein HGG78_18655 [Vibrio aestuarianus]|uniref:hypothetical protein n=1 Tax=Vibrio aestuarianus TaxID=28171 RepID=UPI001559C8F2|nr:hypothetical protein [Vibrio aestuarianus]NGZ15728.1 hypothetical protein [Vibrio aestuarianus]NKZ51876.1 hypothetical protein [Vibrio aestuarianus]
MSKENNNVALEISRLKNLLLIDKPPDFIKQLPKIVSSLDSNGNGLRDDIEIYISHRFPLEPGLRASLIQMSKIIERIYTDAKQSSDSRQVTLWIEENAALRCFKRNGFNYDDLNYLKSILLDSDNKRRSYNEVVKYRSSLDPALIFIVKNDLTSCDSIIFENQVFIQSF